jgi:hypothetical protein
MSDLKEPKAALRHHLQSNRDALLWKLDGQTTDQGTDQTLDPNRLTLMSGCLLDGRGRPHRTSVELSACVLVRP